MSQSRDCATAQSLFAPVTAQFRFVKMISLSAMKVMPAPGLADVCGALLRAGGRRLGWVGLLLVLVLAPVLGQMHRIHHPAWRAAAAPAVLALTPDTAAAEPGQVRAEQWLDRLFSHHSGDADCLVFDQLGHDAPPQAIAVADLGPALSHFLPWWLDATLVATTAARCQARAPPLSR